MENATAAVSKLFSSAPSETVEQKENLSDNRSTPAPAGNDVEEETTDSTVAPAVEHTHVKKEHETREQKVVDKEIHQDHYHTTVQPLKDSEVKAEKHDYKEETKHRNINNDDSGEAKAKAEADLAGFKSTSDKTELESKTKEATKESEHVHHHLHETIQPVIEKEVFVPSVTHKTINVKEKIQDPSVHHGMTTNSAIPVEEFEVKLAGGKSKLEGGKTESSTGIDKQADAQLLEETRAGTVL